MAIITGRVEYELREIQDRVPKEVGPDLKNLKSMNTVWEFLDKEYGSVMELTKELISSLVDFKYGDKTKGNYQKFQELYRMWTSVHNDLQEAGELGALEHKYILSQVAVKFLPDSRSKYVEY